MQLHLNLSDDQIAQFDHFEELLMEWNEVMNLTRITDDEDVINRHFIDSLCLIKADSYLEVPMDGGTSVLDMGTGGGFPGIPLKIMYPDIRIVLVDSLEKRVRFVQRVIDELMLRDAQVIHSRAEDFGRSTGRRESFDLCVSRAVAALPVLAEYTLPYLKIGGQAVYYKGMEIEEEINSARRAFTLLGGKYPVHTVKYLLPDTDIGRSLVVVNKVAETPVYYPRKAGTPERVPISG